MATLTELQAELEELKYAKRSGIQSVSHKGRTVTYRSMDELDRAISATEAEIAKLTGKPTLRTVRIYSRGKGL